ncbi:MAG TPA: LysE family translocator [Desulfobacteraceae bacterium]|nr:LysE family translocator [Desulfobacteraceae bacterium]
MLYFLTVGTVLGLSAGFAPGPLLALVISETLRHGIPAGVRVALAPIITDLPIILLTLLVLAKLSAFHNILGALSLAGSLFLLILAWQSLRTRGIALHIRETAPKSLTKGVAANALNPHPYLFWISVGAPTMTKALTLHLGALLAFLVSFYVFLVGSKILLALFVGRSRSFLSGRPYILTMRFLGLILALFALVLFRDGLFLLNIL